MVADHRIRPRKFHPIRQAQNHGGYFVPETICFVCSRQSLSPPELKPF
jgi:hypothetical protein